MSGEVRWTITGIALVFMAIGCIWLLFHPTALRDDSEREPKPYSYARVQLWLWTFVILPCWIVLWGMDNSFRAFNATCVALLGIGSATTISGRIIDSRDSADPSITRHQDREGSKGFFEDILSDEKGVSIHRFQNLVFNLAYALWFALQTFAPKPKPDYLIFPEFSADTLALLGISSATYVALKATENKSVAPSTARSTSSDELLDPGGYDDVPVES
jgi:hypothetical protein